MTSAKLPKCCSHFLSCVSRIRLIPRWTLKRNSIKENVMEHSWEVSVIAHLLGVINRAQGRRDADANKLVVAALYHDCAEAITGDLPTPIKYHSLAIQQAYQAIESAAEQQLVGMLPKTLRPEMAAVITMTNLNTVEQALVKAADSLSAYRKAKLEVDNGNSDYQLTLEDLTRKLAAVNRPEVTYFMETFLSGDNLSQEALLTLTVSA